MNLRSDHFHAFGLSDIGLVRPNNEDVWIALPELGFFAIADGMGGHQAGEVAAKETIEHLTDSIRKLIERPATAAQAATHLKAAIEKANSRVYQMSRQFEHLAGMGTTLCCIYWTAEGIVCGHVGDSRIYRLRKNQLDRLTQDHSLLAKWKALDKRASACETPYPYKNVITRAVGTQSKTTPEIQIVPLEPEDLFLLCSDGLTDVLNDEEIKQIILRSPDFSLAAARLIEKAKIKGSHDNITVLLIQGLNYTINFKSLK